MMPKNPCEIFGSGNAVYLGHKDIFGGRRRSKSKRPALMK
jgi:hypothetical protein